jgi:hypothetical protein
LVSGGASAGLLVEWGHLGFELAGVVDQQADSDGPKVTFGDHSFDQCCLGRFEAHVDLY